MACVRCRKPNLEGGLCPNCAADHDELAPRRQTQTAEYLGGLKLRQMLGFGPRRLRLLMWLKNHPEIERGRWTIQGKVGDHLESVKMAAFQFEDVLVEST